MSGMRLKDSEDILSDGDQDLEEFSMPRNAGTTGYIDFETTHQTTMETHIPESNVGYRLLQMMGWKAGQGLGADGQGRVDPIRIDIKEDSLGVGKAEEELAYHVSSTAKRKALDSEKQLEETVDDRIQREEKAQRQSAIARELSEVKRAFYCELCDKQYNKIGEYEQHLQSYDHHHKKRFKDMKEQARKTSFAKSEIDKKREREKKREERELKRMQEAILKNTKPAPTPQKASTLPIAQNNANSSSGSSRGGGGGWATVSVPKPANASGGWSTVANPSTSTTKPSGFVPVTDQATARPAPTPSLTSASKAAPSEKPAASQPSKISFGLPRKKPSEFRSSLKKT